MFPRPQHAPLRGRALLHPREGRNPATLQTCSSFGSACREGGRLLQDGGHLPASPLHPGGQLLHRGVLQPLTKLGWVRIENADFFFFTATGIIPQRGKLKMHKTAQQSSRYHPSASKRHPDPTLGSSSQRLRGKDGTSGYPVPCSVAGTLSTARDRQLHPKPCSPPGDPGVPPAPQLPTYNLGQLLAAQGDARELHADPAEAPTQASRRFLGCCWVLICSARQHNSPIRHSETPGAGCTGQGGINH